jgi:hypothetical protein
MPSPTGPRVQTIEVPIEAIIRRRDPTFYKDRKTETEYQFSNNRVFKCDPATRGAYNDTPNVR